MIDACVDLNLHWFATLAEVRSIIERWRKDYNESRPHMALGYRTPQEYLLHRSLSGSTKTVTAGEG